MFTVETNKLEVGERLGMDLSSRDRGNSPFVKYTKLSNIAIKALTSQGWVKYRIPTRGEVSLYGYDGLEGKSRCPRRKRIDSFCSQVQNVKRARRAILPK